MQLQHIDLKNLKLSPLNVRKHGSKNGDDLIPSIKANGIIQPLLVRPTRSEEGANPTGKQECEGFEIIAGQRRYNACLSLSQEQDISPLPCAIMEEGDDAGAIEASLIENIQRLPMDEIDQYEAFLALTKQGKSIDDIATHFGVTETLVKQRLAIANLYTPILNAYRQDKIKPATIRLLTMASQSQQKQWFKLFTDDQEPPPYNLKSWLFGGEEIPVSNALFDLKSYKGSIVSDLFGEERYFADPALFWEHQSRALAEITTELQEDGWQDVILLDVGEKWYRCDYSDWPQEKGGQVFIEVKADGAVDIHKGLLLSKEIKHLEQQKISGIDKSSTDRPELTQPMQNYLNLHRHAVVRTELLGNQALVLRLTVAHIIAGSSLWDISADPQKANSDVITESLQSNKADSLFRKDRLKVQKLLGLKADGTETIVPRKKDYEKSHDLIEIFIKLQALSDKQVMSILSFIVAETLAAGSDMVELLGSLLSVDMAQHWTQDDTFLDLLRDKETINTILEDVGGKTVAEGNLASTATVQKQIIKNFLDGTRTPQKKEWQPRYMDFPMQGYTKRQDTITAVKSGKLLAKMLRAV
ncbi:MAG: ParB/RepB/Spo0J family partition protein [Hyphomicrobiales bacterium]